MRKFLQLTLAVMLVASANLFAQVTTSSITGEITDAAGQSLPGATIVAVHQPSGTEYGTTTQSTGRFNIPGMRVGGPYQVKVTFVGYKEQVFNDVYLSLGTAATLNVKLVGMFALTLSFLTTGF